MGKLLKDQAPEVRYIAAVAIGRIGPEAKVETAHVLAPKQKDREGGVFADWALEEIQAKPHSELVLNTMARATTNFD